MKDSILGMLFLLSPHIDAELLNSSKAILENHLLKKIKGLKSLHPEPLEQTTKHSWVQGINV